ncbi:MFS transporter [Streptomyces sp. LP05-1]|uniref:MFS transporter n=1 Tax=Streptomyces pyxinae TaxID=2970734 RepID=A0ABT2CH01_9ACTN|nr:MFS transporter [Streptomyces sp. LP05-1]MCS0636680.1 MFS transporter [Streptomyces sp. LP05-1]
MFATVAAAVFMSNLDLFIVNVALPAMGRSFGGSDLGSLSWVLNGYAIVFAALLVVAGRVADRSGHKPVFLAGLAVFTLASVGCALAPNVGTLVAARLVQAAGAALVMPTSLALLLDTTAPERRAGAVRAWASLGGIAAGLGPVAGGLLVEAGWRWVFLVNVPVGIAAFALGVKVLPSPGRVGTPKSPLPDLFGAVLLTGSIATLALGLVKAPDWGWTSAGTVGGLAAAVLLGAWFVLRSARHPVPIVELPLLRVPAFASAAAALTLFTVAFAGMLLGAVLWCQGVWGYSALRTGLAIAPGPLLVPAVALLLGPAVARWGAGRAALAGSVVFAAGTLWWAATLGTGSAYAASLLPGMVLTGLGVGMTLPVLTGASAAALPPARFATGSAITSMGRQIGAVLGVAILVGILDTPAPGHAVAAFRHGWYALAAASLLAACATVPLLREPRPAAARATGAADAVKAGAA